MSGRIDKVNQAVKREISSIIQYELKDPRLGMMITVTKVEVSRDLQHARVFFSVLGDKSQTQAAQEGLESARGFIRKLVGQRVRMRYTPEINFICDHTAEYNERIEQALKETSYESEENPQSP